MYIKGTEEQCLAYNAEVTAGEKYTGFTVRWEIPIMIEGFYYILVNSKYPTTLPTVPNLPPQPEPDEPEEL